MSTFKIDFFEFAFLVEACIPPKPIARTMFWRDVINVYYHEMSTSERDRLFEWITEDSNFDITDKDAKWFYDRYNPDNQYVIQTKTKDGVKTLHHTFKHYDEYCISTTSFILGELILDDTIMKSMHFNVDSY
jgi:hypothetical protein